MPVRQCGSRSIGNEASCLSQRRGPSGRRGLPGLSVGQARGSPGSTASWPRLPGDPRAWPTDSPGRPRRPDGPRRCDKQLASLPIDLEPHCRSGSLLGCTYRMLFSSFMSFPFQNPTTGAPAVLPPLANQETLVFTLVFDRDNFVAGTLGKPGEVLLRGRIVCEHLQHASHLNTIHGLPRLEERLGAEEANAVNGLRGCFTLAHAGPPLPSACSSKTLMMLKTV